MGFERWKLEDVLALAFVMGFLAFVYFMMLIMRHVRGKEVVTMSEATVVPPGHEDDEESKGGEKDVDKDEDEQVDENDDLKEKK